MGRWSGVPLQVHVFFLLFAAVVFCVEWHIGQRAGIASGTALATVLIVFFSALFHELAHAFATVNLGGRVEELVITPWGGPSKLISPIQPKSRLVVHAAGPFLNGMVFLICAVLLTFTGQTTFAALVNPLDPHLFIAGVPEISLLKIAAWVNFQMMVVNLLPVYPFDGTRMIRAAVLTYNPRASLLRLESALMGIGIGTGLVLFLFAWMFSDYNVGFVQPTWFILICAGILLIFAARYNFHCEITEAQNELGLLDELVDYESLYDYDDADEETSEQYLDEFEDELISDWLKDQRSKSENAERSIELEEERQVDRILEKLHRKGIEALSDEERAFLNRISLQYRRRRELRS